MVLEALALQTPVIATPAGGVCCEILADQHNCVVSKGSTASSIAQAIDKWIFESGRNICADAAARFEAETIVKRFEMLFDTQLSCD